MEECNKVNIPRVDNSAIPCEEYFKAECSYLTNIDQELIDYYELEDPAKLEDVMAKILLAIKDIRTRLITLEEL